MTRRPDIPRRPRRVEADAGYDRARSFRMSDETWRAVQRTAERDGLTASFVMGILARDYANHDLETPPVTTGSETTKSARIDDETWDAFRARAESEGVRATRVLVGLAEEYARGLISLHVHIVSSQARRPG